ELPMTGHGVGSKQLHAIDHVLALGAVGAERALPGVASVEEEHTILAAFSAHGLHDGGGAVEPADAPVAAGECDKVVSGERMGEGGAGGCAEPPKRVTVGKVSQEASLVSEARVD